MFGGSIVSIIGLYLLCIDIKKIVESGQAGYGRSIMGYLQRYTLYGVYMGIMAKFFGMPMLICSALGLLSIKGNILLMALSDKVLKLREKHLK